MLFSPGETIELVQVLFSPGEMIGSLNTVSLHFWFLLFRSTLLSRVSKVGPCVHTYVHTSVRPSTKRFFDFCDIWRVGRG